MTCARTLVASLLAVLAPFAAHADGITFTKYSVAPTSIYLSPPSGSALATSTAIALGFSQKVRASILIEDASGAIVRALYSSTGVTNPSPKVWDGKNDAGAYVAPGTYTIAVSAATSTLSLTDASQTVTVATVPAITPPAFAAQSYTLPITAGWNLLSLPVVPASTAAADVFGPTTADAVWTYDPTDPLADVSGWLVYDPTQPEFSNLSNLSPGAGYFVHATSPSSLAISGALLAPGIPPPSRSLAAGWNLVGSYASSSEDIDDAFASIGWAGLEYTALWKLDASTQSFVLPSMVDPGDAFWIFLDAPHTYAPADL